MYSHSSSRRSEQYDNYGFEADIPPDYGEPNDTHRSDKVEQMPDYMDDLQPDYSEPEMDYSDEDEAGISANADPRVRRESTHSSTASKTHSSKKQHEDKHVIVTTEPSTLRNSSSAASDVTSAPHDVTSRRQSISSQQTTSTERVTVVDLDLISVTSQDAVRASRPSGKRLRDPLLLRDVSVSNDRGQQQQEEVTVKELEERFNKAYKDIR